MAEFKISQFRYTWRGAWSSSRAYARDDVVRYGGSSWVCARTHTSSLFETDQTFLENPSDTDFTPAWIKMTDGYEFRGNWSPSTLYNPGDIVKYSGNLYIVVSSYTSSSIFDDNLSDLSFYIEGTNWRSNWSPSTRYGIGDLVRYGGRVLICMLGHTSGTAVEGPNVGNNDSVDDSTFETWSIYIDGIEFKGDYSDDDVRYKENDIVVYNGSLLRCISGYTSSMTFDDTKWEIESDGHEFEEEWSADEYYGVGSVVRSGGYKFYAIKANYNKPPINSIYQTEYDADAPYWEIFTKNYNFRGVWDIDALYKTGDVVRRGGTLYEAILDTAVVPDGSTLDYLDTSNWKILNISINWRGFWTPDELYSKGDAVSYLGAVYTANVEHVSVSGLDSNSPGDNGNGYEFWDILIDSITEVGMSSLGDLLTYDLKRRQFGDQSTFGATSVPIGAESQVLTIDSTDSLFYKTYGNNERMFYVSTDGIDDIIDSNRGINPFKPWKTVRFACEQADDGFAGFTKIYVGVGQFDEILPIIVPARTVVIGSELRSTTIRAAGPVAALANDSTYTKAVLTRIFGIIQNILGGTPIVKTPSNPLDQVILYQGDGVTPLSINATAGTDIQDLILDIESYLDFYIGSSGSAPELTGSNDAIDDEGYNNAALVLEANKNFLAEEAVAFMRTTYPSYAFDGDLCKRDTRRYVDAWKYDIIYTGNYKSLFAARYYRNSVLGSSTEDMFYFRDATGLRNCTLKGLTGTLNPPDTFDLYRRPTGGSYASLDPGWGPDDERTWIATRSPYIQGVTNLGENCVGMKIDGNLHNGGNKSMVANDFTQVLSDGIGAWALNGGRTELVSVFTYYCTIGYYTKDGGIIRGTNGNCSYGNYGAISDGVDPEEIPQTVTVNGRNQEADVYQALAGEFVDEITVLEFNNAGVHYTEATGSILGAGVNASILFDDFRDGSVFEARLTDTLPTAVFVGSIEDTVLTVTEMISGVIGLAYNLTGEGVNEGTQVLSYESASGGVGTYNLNQSQTVSSTVMQAVTTNLIAQYVGGGGFSVQQNNAQPNLVTNGDLTSIVLAASDDRAESDYLGKKIIITSGTGTGQYGYISAYDEITKVATVSRDSDDQLGWDHVIAGRLPANPLDTTTRYRIEPRVVFSDPPFEVTSISTPISANWASAAYGETTQTFTGIDGELGTGSVITDDGLLPSVASFDIVKNGRSYTVTVNDPGAGYSVGDQILIEGETVGGTTGVNDITIIVTEITNDSTNSILAFTYEGLGASGKFVALPDAGTQGIISSDGETWEALTLPYNGNWAGLTSGNGVFVAVVKGTNRSYRSLNGTTWSLRNLPSTSEWTSITYGDGIFLAIAEDGDKGAFSRNAGVSWTATTLPNLGDSTFNEWVDVTYGKGIFVAIAKSNNASARGVYNSGTNTISWTTHVMDVIADSSQKDWVSVAYGNNRFVAISNQGDVAYSFDGDFWYPATMPTQDGSTAHSWYNIRYAQGVFFAVGDTGGKDVGSDATLGPSTFAATSPDGVVWYNRELEDSLEWRVAAFGNPFIDPEDSASVPNTPLWITLASNSNVVNKIRTGAKALGRAYVTSGKITRITLFDTGSGYIDPPTVTIVDPNKTSSPTVEARIGDGVLTNPSWINRGLGYRTLSTTVTITGDGYADKYTVGKFVTVDGLDFYPGPGAQVIFNGGSERYVVSSIEELGNLTHTGLSAIFRISPQLKVRDNLEHGISATIQIRYSQNRLTGHDFLDIGTGNFIETNYPELYSIPYFSQPEDEIYEEDGGRVFYTSTDQSGNFRTGELFAVEQATGIVTISADFFDLGGLSELRLGGIRVGGTGAVIREFSTDALFTADSNNIIPTQRAIRAYLNNRLTVGGSEIATASFIAGLIRVGPDIIGNTIGTKIIVKNRAEFEGVSSGVSGMMLAQSMFYRSFRRD